MFQESYVRKVVVAVGIAAVIALLAYTYSTIKSSRYLYSGPVSISVIGEGEVTATPDIATFSFNLEAKEADAVSAQNKAADTMKAILAYVKESGVEDKDVKVESYNLSPQYEYAQTVCTQWGCPPTKEPKIIGYQVNQQVAVKVRDTAKAGALVSGIGSKGALNVTGLTFTIDDTDVFKAQARALAIKDAKEKADKLAKDLGVRIVRMNGYSEDGGYPMPYYAASSDMMMKSASPEMAQSAELPMGENTISAQVNISYEIK